jgi:hypothetical protein
MVAVADAPAIGWVMKHEHNGPKTGKPEAGSGESLHELYQELLCLRVEVIPNLRNCDSLTIPKSVSL